MLSKQLKTGMDQDLAQAKDGKPGRRYLPHASLGQLQLTLARDKTYICAGSNLKFKHLLCVYDKGRFGCSKHQEVGTKLFEKVSEGNLDLDGAKKLRQQLIDLASD